MCDKKLIGSFFFKRTVNGNLIGEFSNNRNPSIITESCDLVTQNEEDQFLGTYSTSWREGRPTGLTLTIQQHRRSNFKFSLIWRRDETIEYSGEGFLVDNMLIGFYVEGEIPR